MNAASSRPRISLLHATYRRTGGPLEVRDAWLSRAADPDTIEYVMSMDDDDDATVTLTEGLPRLVNPSLGGAVTAVRNWNAAAAESHGDLLFVIADDLFPPHGWDRTLTAIIRGLDPRRTAFAVKVADSPQPEDTRLLLRHPVISRAFYTKFGLFSPAYRGVYCDDDFTTRAFWRSAIIDGRSLQLEHRHPSPCDEVASSESFERLNRREEYRYGAAQYSAEWSHRRRKAKWSLVPTASSDGLTHWGIAATQRQLRLCSNIDYVVRGFRKAVRLLHVAL
jgi:hypothetical protein